jgi:hypothetical protein
MGKISPYAAQRRPTHQARLSSSMARHSGTLLGYVLITVESLLEAATSLGGWIFGGLVFFSNFLFGASLISVVTCQCPISVYFSLGGSGP